MNITIDQVQLRRDSAANWTSANPVLLLGEPGVESDTGQVKVGDGSAAWADLPYVGAGGETSLTVMDNLIAPLVAAYGDLPQVATLLGHLAPLDNLFAIAIGLTGATDPDWATQVEEITALYPFTFAGGGAGPKPLEHRILAAVAGLAGLKVVVDTNAATLAAAATTFGTDADAALSQLQTDADAALLVSDLVSAIDTFAPALQAAIDTFVTTLTP